ncbi:MAG: hypothetical protein FWD97_05325 [Defluviitaleaceae bacterium]|nr:hypothetical protein [Defluviitaleaceae bacterium]
MADCFNELPFLTDGCTILVGAGIARPIYVDDTVQSYTISSTGKGRAMPAPTIDIGDVGMVCVSVYY